MFCGCYCFPQDETDELATEILLLRTNVQEKVLLSDDDILTKWRQIFTNDHKQLAPRFFRLLEIALTLPHGNAEPERIFSRLKDILTPKRQSLSQECLNAIICTRDVIHAVGGATKVPITVELKQKCLKSHSAYIDHQKQIQEKQLEAAEKARTLLKKKFSEALTKDSALNGLNEQRAIAEETFNSEKRVLDQHDHFIADLTKARDEKKKNMENAFKEKERIDRKVDSKKRKLLDDVIHNSAKQFVCIRNNSDSDES